MKLTKGQPRAPIPSPLEPAGIFFFSLKVPRPGMAVRASGTLDWVKLKEEIWHFSRGKVGICSRQVHRISRQVHRISRQVHRKPPSSTQKAPVKYTERLPSSTQKQGHIAPI